MKVILLCTAICAVWGCSTPSPTVEIPVAVSCIPKDAPRAPQTASNAALAALDDYRLVITIAAERDALQVYAAQADAIIEACR